MISPPSALSSPFRTAEAVSPGDVLAIDQARPGLLALSRSAEDPAVVGIVVAEPSVALGFDGSEERPSTIAPDARVPVAISGVTACRVDAGYGSIRPGDLLTSSPTPGHAMRSFDAKPGTVLGKALESLDDGTGTIRVLVMPR